MLLWEPLERLKDLMISLVRQIIEYKISIFNLKLFNFLKLIDNNRFRKKCIIKLIKKLCNQSSVYWID